jgi:hypothetical protein
MTLPARAREWRPEIVVSCFSSDRLCTRVAFCALLRWAVVYRNLCMCRVNYKYNMSLYAASA